MVGPMPGPHIILYKYFTETIPLRESLDTCTLNAPLVGARHTSQFTAPLNNISPIFEPFLGPDQSGVNILPIWSMNMAQINEKF